jgi:hypothetical protein
MAVLTREEMSQVIRDGGSVLHEGRLYTTIDGLPSEAALAKGDPAKAAAATEALDAQIKALQDARARLEADVKAHAAAALAADEAKAKESDPAKPADPALAMSEAPRFGKDSDKRK